MTVFPNLFNVNAAKAALHSCPDYNPTPLTRKEQWLIKDETKRFGVGNFKALGGTYAVWNLLRSRQDKQTTFVTASAGNHGLSVAIGASLFGARARIYLPVGTPQEFSTRLHKIGADVVRLNIAYDEAVAMAKSDCGVGEVLLPDTSDDQNAPAPRLVMEGYTVMADEIFHHCETEWPNTVYLQAGVGGFAAAMSWHIRNYWPVQPRIVIVEPASARCVSAALKAGQPISIEGAPSSLRRLDCKRASALALKILKSCDVECTSITDAHATVAAKQMSVNFGIQTSTCGAAGYAAAIANNQSDMCLVIATEGLI